MMYVLRLPSISLAGCGKKTASGVLASLRGSTYDTEYDRSSSLAAALLDSLFAHPAWRISVVLHLETRDGYSGQNEFFRSLLGVWHPTLEVNAYLVQVATITWSVWKRVHYVGWDVGGASSAMLRPGLALASLTW